MLRRESKKRKTEAFTNEAAALVWLKYHMQCGIWEQTSFSLFCPRICWFNTNQWIKGACFQQGNFSRFYTSFHQCFFQKIIKRVRITGNVTNHNHSLMMKVGPLLGPYFLLEQIRTPSLGWGLPWTWFLIGNFSEDFTKKCFGGFPLRYKKVSLSIKNKDWKIKWFVSFRSRLFLPGNVETTWNPVKGSDEKILWRKKDRFRDSNQDLNCQPRNFDSISRACLI